jgi:transcriptional regulator with XRE-family HTH domain
VHKENTVPKRLKEARTKAGITQADLGAKIGIHQNSSSSRMNHYELGRHTPDINTLQRIADELGVPLNYFFCEDDASAKLACLIDQLPKEQKITLIKKLEAQIKD